MTVPEGPQDLTPEWLTQALSQPVETVSIEAVGTGQTGSSYRLTLDGERTMIAKLGAEDPEVRARVAYGYRAEVAFYRDIAPTVDVPVPHCFATAISDDASTFVLLLEDLAPAVQGDQIAGCSPDIAIQGATALAGLHGPRWCDPTWKDLEVLTMPLATEESAGGMGDLARMATDIFLDTLGDRMTAEDKQTLNAFPARVPAWLLACPERFALLHGDYRLDNVMLRPEGLTVVDWQTLTIGLPARDLAYWIATSLDPRDRRITEQRAVAAYHAALDVEGYALGVCEEDYRVGQLQVPLIATLGWAFTTQTPRGADMMLAMVARSCAAIRDLHALEAV